MEAFPAHYGMKVYGKATGRGINYSLWLLLFALFTILQDLNYRQHKAQAEDFRLLLSLSTYVALCLFLQRLQDIQPISLPSRYP